MRRRKMRRRTRRSGERNHDTESHGDKSALYAKRFEPISQSGMIIVVQGVKVYFHLTFGFANVCEYDSLNTSHV